MKDIMLKITGKQLVGEEAEEKMKFITEGKLFERGGAKYLMYEESEFSGMPGCKTTLKLTDTSIRLKRIGEHADFGHEMVFEKGKRYNSRYKTPYGEMDLEILTNDVVNNLSEEGFGTIGIDYHVSLGGMAEGRNQLSIEVLQ